MSIKDDHREKNLLSIVDFAKKKKVAHQSVTYQIEKGNILPVYIGMHKHMYIDWLLYQDFQFNKNMKRF